MKLLESFNRLKIPITNKINVFNSFSLKEFTFIKIAVNYLGYPIVLIKCNVNNHAIRRNISLKYIELTYNNTCKISEIDTIIDSGFIVITFKTIENTLVLYFFRIIEILINTLSLTNLENQIDTSLKHFVELFRALDSPPLNTIQGLWSELFIIENAKNPLVCLNHWHSNPEEKFDFNSGIFKLEVKSSSLLNRIHHFSAEQLYGSSENEILIASVFVKQTYNGVSLLDLITNIDSKLSNTSLMEKLMTTLSKTLGNTIEQAVNIKYDYNLAKCSLKFYRYQDIEKIEEINVSNKISEVHYKSDLSTINNFILQNNILGSELFNSL